MQRRNDGRYNRNDYNRQNKTCLDWINGICTRTNCKFFHPETHPYYIYASKTNDIHPDELHIGCMYNNLQEQADAIWVDNYIQLITEYKNSSNFTIPSYRSFCIPFDSNKVYGEIKQFQSDIRGNYKRDNRSNRNDFSRNNYSSHGYQGGQNYQRNQNGQSSQNSQSSQRNNNNYSPNTGNNYRNNYRNNSSDFPTNQRQTNHSRTNDSAEYEEYRVPYE
ncbi:hypothetical protein ECANGB1_781 [Enterospora canceri]|uniref:C3H1-type domain-containing protein n=1 Tax=Enterospora canceri TaxID=1081671 RepID=A0A1Y1S7I2_9MICR|nr:hypothetical protein ECANGB1_781 [Enterospora canceri]